MEDKSAKKPVRYNLKLRGWKGDRKIPAKQIREFVKDILTIPDAGFHLGTLEVQIGEKYLPKLDPILKKHGLVEAHKSRATIRWGPEDAKKLLQVPKKPKVYINVVFRPRHGKILKADNLKRFLRDIKKVIPEMVWDPKRGSVMIPKKERKKLDPILNDYGVWVAMEDFAKQELPERFAMDDLDTIKMAAAIAKDDPNAAYALLDPGALDRTAAEGVTPRDADVALGLFKKVQQVAGKAGQLVKGVRRGDSLDERQMKALSDFDIVTGGFWKKLPKTAQRYIESKFSHLVTEYNKLRRGVVEYALSTGSLEHSNPGGVVPRISEILSVFTSGIVGISQVPDKVASEELRDIYAAAEIAKVSPREAYNLLNREAATTGKPSDTPLDFINRWLSLVGSVAAKALGGGWKVKTIGEGLVATGPSGSYYDITLLQKGGKLAIYVYDEGLRTSERLGYPDLGKVRATLAASELVSALQSVEASKAS